VTCTMGGWSCRLGQRRRPGEAGGVRLRGAHVTEQACRGVVPRIGQAVGRREGSEK
jgi:hypothetical protein